VTGLNTESPAFTHEVFLSVEQLLKWDEWTPGSRPFVTERADGDALVLLPIVQRHGELLIEVNGWLLDELGAANSAALEDAKKLVVERNAVLSFTDPDSSS